MYLIKAGERIIYDSTDKNTYPVISPQLDDEMNGAGSLTFTILPGHPYYNDMKEMQTFITAYRDDEEIFYGRILSTDRQIDGQLEVTCEGGLTFFLDSEMSKATYNETCENFLNRILANHNSMMEEAKRFSLGIVNVPKAIEEDPDTHNTKKWEFKISGYANTKNVLESLVLGQFGGYFRVRPDGNGGHLIDYIEDYGRINNQRVRIGHNIVDKNDRTSGEGMFTILRPIYGQNKTIENLTQADVTLPNVTKDGEFLILDDMIDAGYGRIYHTEAFDKVTNAKECLKRAETFITERGTQVPASTEIGFVDFYHLNADEFRKAQEEAALIDYPHLVNGITFEMGNVDLLNRPVISMVNVTNAGWDDGSADPSDMATLYSVTYSGGLMKNLNPGAAYNRTHIQKQDDGSILLNGNIAERIDYYFINGELAKANAIHLPPGTYTAHIELLSGTLNSTGAFGYYYWDGSGSRTLLTANLTSASVSHTFTNDAYIFPIFRIEPDSRPNNANIGYKLERGSTTTSFTDNVDYGLTENLMMVVTPIKPSGDVLSPKQLEEYFDDLVNNGALTRSGLIQADSQTNGGSGLIIGIAQMPGTISQSITLADAWAEELHETQEELYSHYIQDIKLGDRFTNIEEFENVTLTVGDIHIDMENPGNDTMTLKNQEELNGKGVTGNSLTIIESKYAKQDAFRYHYINEQVDEVEGYLQIWGPKFEVGTQAFETYTNRTFMTVIDDADHPGEYKLQALRFGELDDDPSAPYAPTILMNVGGIRLSDQNKLVGEDGSEVTTSAALSVQATRITQEVIRAGEAEAALVGRIDTEAGKIQAIAGDLETVTDDVGDLQISYDTLTGSALWANRDALVALNGKFEIDANGVVHVIEGSGLMVDRDSASFGVYDSQNLTAGIIVNKINNGSVSINASKIYLNGETVADAISATNANFTNLTTGVTQAAILSATSLVGGRLVISGSMEIGGNDTSYHTISWGMGSLDSKSFLGYSDMTLGHYHTLNVDSTTGTVTIGAPTATSSQATFNIADTTFYQQAVSAADAAGWARGYSDGIDAATPTSIRASDASAPTHISSGWTSSTTLTPYVDEDAGTPYNGVINVDAPYNAGANSVNLSESWNGATYTVSTTGQTTSHSASITLSATSAIVYNSSTHTYLAGATAEAGGATRAYDATPAESGTEAYQAGVTDGEGNVTITAVTPGSQSGPDASNIYTVPISVTASNGATGSGTATVDASDSYTAGETAGIGSVTISSVTGGTPTLSGNTYTVPLTATASNSATGTGSATVDASARYTAGQNSIRMAKSWSGATATISRTTASSGTTNNITITIGATAGITYNSSAHTYTASAQASADSAVRASNTKNSGTEAYNAGWNDCRTTTLNTSERLRVVDSTETVYDEWGNRYTALTGSHWANFYTVPAAK